MAKGHPPLVPLPWIDAYKPGIDMTLIRENLKLTPTERLQKLEAAQMDLAALRESARTAGWGGGPKPDPE